MADKKQSQQGPESNAKSLASANTSSKANLTQVQSQETIKLQAGIKPGASAPKPDTGNVRVVCRFRPLNEKEKELQNETVCVEFKDKQTVKIRMSQPSNSEAGGGTPSFSFDRVFDVNAHQQEVYEFAAKPVIESVLQGFNGTVFAYGQTSSGKTHTMQGPDIDDSQLKGIIPRMVTTVFETIMNSSEYIEYTCLLYTSPSPRDS
eukprot:TRINITY_DN16858_c0_g1_i1.p2 TRINITY_DN16858_c0_g1~~TRINITY_DN16858_c0_g1_i1.p2  ORF type:complete len:205 (+),score=33.28 TRINITY_DN16858_c0_g1_i1:115-729(+)